MIEREKEILNVPEAAEFLGISERTLRGLIGARRVPFARVGGSLRLRRTALVEWLRQEEQRSLGPEEKPPAPGRMTAAEREERAARVRAIVGKYAHVPFSSDDLIRERQAELEQEERRGRRSEAAPAGESRPTGR